MKPTHLALAAFGVFTATVVGTLVVLHLPDTNRESATESAASSTPSVLSYGPLGRPNWSDPDHPDISRRSPQANLAEFRWWIQHPPKGNDHYFVRQGDIDEFYDRQRSLFYEVAKRAPQLLTQSDLKALRDADNDLYESSCDSRNATDVPPVYKLSWQQCAPNEKREADLRNKPEFPGHPDWCQNHRDTNGNTVFESYCPANIVSQARAAEVSGRLVRDMFATGSAKASAEWQSVTHPNITCGITPTDRYLTVRNEIGSTKYDEPAQTDWKQLGCQETEPVNQQHLIDEANQQAAVKYNYEHSHHFDVDCALNHLGPRSKEYAATKDDCWRPGPEDYTMSEARTTWRSCTDAAIGTARDSGKSDPTDAELATACGPEPQ